MTSVTLDFLDAPPSTMMTVQVSSPSSAQAAIVRGDLAALFSTASNAQNVLTATGVSVVVELVPVTPTLPPPGGSTSVVVESVIQLAGTLTHYQSIQEAMAQSLAAALNVSRSSIVLSFVVNPPSLSLIHI